MFNRRKYQIFVLIKHFDNKTEKEKKQPKKVVLKSFELFTKKKKKTCALGQSSLN